MLRALAGCDGVPVPKVLFDDAGDPVCDFTVPRPEPCAERVPRALLVANLHDDRSTEFREPAYGAARTLVALHRLEPAAIGLGRGPVVSIEADTDRWAQAYETTPAHLQFNIEVAEALYVSIPPAVRAAATWLLAIGLLGGPRDAHAGAE